MPDGPAPAGAPPALVSGVQRSASQREMRSRQVARVGAVQADAGEDAFPRVADLLERRLVLQRVSPAGAWGEDGLQRASVVARGQPM